jgi:hypothetical protein
MKKQILLTTIISLSIGILIGLFISTYNPYKKMEYFELQEDYIDDGLGVIKKGTLLKFDQSYSEGFARFILYLNIDNSEAPKFKEKSFENKVIPYWIEKKE